LRILHLSATNILATRNGPAEMERRTGVLRELASPGTAVDLWENADGPLSIETEDDEKAAIPGLLRNVARARGYDAITLGCFGDPGLFEIRKATDVPVLGPGICAMHAASLIASKFSILVPVKTSVPLTLRQAGEYGFAGKLVSVRPLDIAVLTIREERERAVDAAVRVAGECVEKDGAEVLVLGCMSMAFQRLNVDMREILGVRVINPLIPMVRFAETLVVSFGAGRSQK